MNASSLTPLAWKILQQWKETRPVAVHRMSRDGSLVQELQLLGDLDTEMSFSGHKSGEIPVSVKIRGFPYDTNVF
jgi:hypothetical protein